MPRGTNRVDEAHLQNRLWTPAVLRPAAWYDAADLSTIATVSGGVSEWRDKSGNGRTVSQATAGNRPTYTTAGLNNLNVLTFSRTNSTFLRTTTSSITSGTYTGQLDFAWVANRTDSIGGTIITERNSSLVGETQWVFDTGAYFISSDGANTNSNQQISAATFALLSTSAAIAYHTHISGSRDRFWLNGAEITVTTGTASNITGSTGISIGRREGNVAQFWTGVIAEIIALPRTTSTSDRLNIEGYLAWKWGLVTNLTAIHPFKNRPPVIGD